MRASAGLLVFCLLVLPLAALFIRFPGLRFPFTQEVASVFWLTLLQAVLSASVSLVLGMIGGIGLIWAGSRLPGRWPSWIETLAFLPNAAPVLLLLLAVMKLMPWARGLTGIVFVHAALNVGLVSVAFAQLVRLKISGPAELAYLEGASGPRFFFRGAWPMLRADLAVLFLFLFAVSFTSFAVPLMIGGSRATTVEVLIYQKIRISGDWSEAMGLALMQMLMVFALSWLLRGRSSVVAFRRVNTPLLSWPPGLIVALFPAALLIFGLFDGVFRGWQQLQALPALLAELPNLIVGSTLVGFGTGLLILALLMKLAYARPSGVLRKILVGYAAPSSVLIGFGLLVFWRATGLATYFKIIFGLALIFLPSFYRYQWDALLQSLDGQIVAAETLGASDWLIFKRVVGPQVAKAACRLSGLAALWAWGDFALSSVVAERAVTVPMIVNGLMGSYRFDAATTLTWIVILGGVVTFGLFAGAGYVLGPKSESRI